MSALPLALLFPGCASLAAVTVRPDDGRILLRFLHHPALLEPGGHLRVRPEGGTTAIYVLALGNGGWSALSPICTHQGCTVDVSGSRLVCPCHGSTYDREGNVLRGPAPQALRRFAVQRSADGLIIDLGGQA